MSVLVSHSRPKILASNVYFRCVAGGLPLDFDFKVNLVVRIRKFNGVGEQIQQYLLDTLFVNHQLNAFTLGLQNDSYVFD